MECEASGREESGEGDEMSQVTVPVLLEVASCQRGESAVGREVAWAWRAVLLLAGDGEGDRLQGLRGGQDHQRTSGPAVPALAAAPTPLRMARARRTWLALAFLRASLSALVLFNMSAVDKRVGGGKWALAAAEGLSRRMFESFVEVEIVLAFAAVAAAVAVERPLTGVHAHMLDELVGRFGEIAALLALVVVSQAVSARVPFQLCLIGPHGLADTAAVLHLVVRLQVALHSDWPVGGVDAERAPGQRDRRSRV